MLEFNFKVGAKIILSIISSWFFITILSNVDFSWNKENDLKPGILWHVQMLFGRFFFFSFFYFIEVRQAIKTFITWLTANYIESLIKLIQLKPLIQNLLQLGDREENIILQLFLLLRLVWGRIIIKACNRLLNSPLLHKYYMFTSILCEGVFI